MKLHRLVEILNELDLGGATGFGSRPDNSGIRGKGLERKPNRRLANYPYDRDVTYGEPGAYDRGSSGAGPMTLPFTPKDDSTYSLKLLGIEDRPHQEIEDMDDEEIHETGDQTNLGIAMKGSGGSTVPGTGIFANNPPRSWEKGPFDESPLNIDTSPPDIEEIPNSAAPDFRMQTDDDLENRINRIFGREDNLNFVDPKKFANPDMHVIAPDPWSVVNTRLSSRGLYGLMPKESAWDRMSGMVLVKRQID